ncbi:MAG: hypothetical protein LBV72_17300 [Tannerella sp.]|jgi:hypothetical protein|nr:hypothetical protein [Tannerella sp.]
MCHFITGIISGKITIEEINSIGDEFGLQFQKYSNEFVEKQLKSDETYIWKRCKYCDCGTPLGMFKRKDNNQTEETQKAEIAKLKQKGWSEAKIQRLMNDRNKKAGQEASKFEQSKRSAFHEVQKWGDFIKKLFNSTSIKTFGILLHWYSGSVNTERITLKERVMIDKTELSTEHLLEMEEDALLIIS